MLRCLLGRVNWPEAMKSGLFVYVMLPLQLGVGDRIHLVSTIFEDNFVERIGDDFLKIIGMQVSGYVAIGWVQRNLFQVLTMIFRDDDEGSRVTKRATTFLATHLEQKLIAWFLIVVPAGNQAGKFVSEQAEATIVLLHGLHSIRFIVGINRRVQTRMTNKRRALIDHCVV